jgi:hypothetical protein
MHYSAGEIAGGRIRNLRPEIQEDRDSRFDCAGWRVNRPAGVGRFAGKRRLSGRRLVRTAAWIWLALLPAAQTEGKQ